MRALLRRGGKLVAPAAALLFTIVPDRTYAQPLRLRGDALVQTRSPVGLVVLRGEDQLKPWVDAETVTWMGVSGMGGSSVGPDAFTGDVLTLSVRMRDAKTGSEMRAGRMIVTTGAVRPVHLDGARGLVRVFGGTTLEAFGGAPVARRFDYATFDWAAGGRLAQSVGDVFTVGGSYLQRRSAGRPADEEAGADAAFTPAPWLTAAGRVAFDLLTHGPSDALASLSAQKDDVRGEVFTTHRSAGRLLPSTSLFSVLGDYAATSTGTTFRWRAFPRLELLATGSAQFQGDELGGQGLARATLALDDEWEGSLGAEIRRVDFGGARWTGARAIVGLPLTARFRFASELELVVPDRPDARGTVWPWALGAVAWRPRPEWDVAIGVEGSSGPLDRFETHALARATYAFDTVEPRR
jgi:hypothetical protein